MYPRTRKLLEALRHGAMSQSPPGLRAHLLEAHNIQAAGSEHQLKAWHTSHHTTGWPLPKGWEEK